MPTTWSASVTSAPPLLPGLIGALVCTAPAIVAPGKDPSRWEETVRPSAETMPLVTLPDRPRGLPIASTIWPTARCAESPNLAGVSRARLTRTTARSLAANSPTSVAGSGVFELGEVTCSRCAPATTWSLVTMSPLSS